MFYAVILSDSKILKVVPENWINFDKFNKKYINSGVRAGVADYVVFISTDAHAEPAFDNAQIDKVFVEDKAGYYMAHILYVLRKYRELFMFPYLCFFINSNWDNYLQHLV